MVLAGICLLVYPNVKSVAAENTQDEMLQAYMAETVVATLPGPIEAQSVCEPSVVLPADVVVDEVLVDQDEVTSAQPIKVKTVDPKKRAIGVLQIDAIDFKQVIMPTASQGDLSVSVGHVKETPWIDEAGNISIAGHRSKKYGRNFNRLKEVLIGDEIQVITHENTISYEVTETFTVAPKEVWVLEDVEDEETITLITCTPLIDPTHRYIVRGKKIQ